MAAVLTRRQAGLAAASLAAAAGARRAAAAEDRVSVYTAHEASIIEALTPRFQRDTGIAAEVVKLGSGDVVNRVRAEARQPRADVIWSVGGEILAANPALLEAYKPAELDRVLDPKFTVSGPWLPYTGVLPVIMVNTAKLRPEEHPRTWADLATPRFKSMVSSARADTSGSAFTQYVTILAAYGDKGPDTYARIFANFALADSSGAVPRYVSDGEALAGITLEDNALQYVRGGAKVAIVYPADGTTINADGIALVKGAPHPEAARRFIDWALSKPVQEQLVQAIGRRSIRSDVAGSAALPPLPEIKTIPYDLEAVSRDRAALISRWKRLADSR